MKTVVSFVSNCRIFSFSTISLLISLFFVQASFAEYIDSDLEELLITKISAVSKYEQKAWEAPASVTIITAEEIEKYGYRTLTEVLNSASGFFIRYDRNYDYIGVRGFNRPTDYINRILLLIDGHTNNERYYGAAFFGSDLSIDLSCIERVEIARGPGSAMYGTGAMLAVVNVVTKKGRGIDGLNAGVEAGSYGRKGGSILFGKEYDSGADFAFSGNISDVEGQDLHYSEYDSVEGGWARGMNREKYYGLIARMTYKKWSIYAYTNSRKKWIPTGSWEMNFGEGQPFTIDQRSSLEAAYEYGISAELSVKFRAYLDYYYYTGKYVYDLNEFDSDLEHWGGSEIQLLWDSSPANRLTCGIEYINVIKAQNKYWDTQEIIINTNHPYPACSIYLQDSYQIKQNLSIQAGLRYDNYLSFGEAVTPRFALVYCPYKSGIFKLLYGEAFRAPNLYETKYVDPGTQIGNDNLEAERITTSEIVWEQKIGRKAWANLTIFNYTMNDIIESVQLNNGSEVLQFQNKGKIEALGVEAGWNLMMAKGIIAYSSFSYQDLKDPLTEEYLTNSPLYIGKGGISARLNSYLNGALDMQYESKRRTVKNTYTDPFLLANLNFVITPGGSRSKEKDSIAERMNIQLKIANLFNTSYSYPAGYEHIQPEIKQDGRNFLLRLNYKLK